jgi:hypothetical protein
MRVSHFLSLPEPDETFIKHSAEITKLRDLMCDKNWTAMKADVAMDIPEEIKSLRQGYDMGEKAYDDPIDYGITALSDLHAKLYPVEAQEAIRALSNPAEQAPAAPEPAAPSAPPPQTNPPAQAAVQDTATDTSEAQQQPPGIFKAPDKAAEGHAPVQTSSRADEEEPAVTASAPEPVSAPVEKIKKKLTADVEKILRDAGSDMRQKLLKSDGNGDNIDAAE